MRDVAVFQVIGKLVCRHHRTVVLALGGRGAQVRNGYHAGHAQHLLGGEVHHVGGNLTALKRGKHIRAVDQPVAGEVQHAHAVLHCREGGSVQHPLGAVQERHVNGHVITRLVNLLGVRHVNDGGRQAPCGTDRQIGVVAVHLHAQRKRGVCHERTDGTQADHAQLLALDFRTGELTLALFHELANALLTLQGGCPLNALHHLAGGKEQPCQHQLLDGVCVGTGSIEYHDSLLAASVNGNVVHAGTRTGDCEQRFGHGKVVHCGRADHHAARALQLLTHGVALSKAGKSAGGNFVHGTNLHLCLSILKNQKHLRGAVAPRSLDSILSQTVGYAKCFFIFCHFAHFSPFGGLVFGVCDGGAPPRGSSPRPPPAPP